jgi:hypothetical protein
MPGAIFWKKKVILFKAEVSYGTDPTATGGANAQLMTDVTYSPMEGEDVSRNLEFPDMAAQGTIPVGLRVRLRAKTELVPSGTAGVAPKWGPLLRVCACSETIVADTSVTYAPISASMESGTLYFWVGSTKQIVKGVRGDATLRFTAQGIPYIEWDLQGLYGDPAEAAAATPTLTGFKKPVVVTNANTPTFTINSVAMVLRELTMALGNDVQPRLLVGREEIIIVDKPNNLITARVEAQPISSFDPFGLAKAQTEVALSLVHGTAAGYITTLAAAQCQLKRPKSYENNQNILEWPLELVPQRASGNDMWSLTLT